MTKPEKVACRNPKEICAQNRKSDLTKHILERRGEPARRRARPRDRPRLDAVLRALHAARGVLHVAAGGPDVRRAPAPGGQRVVSVAAPPAHRAPGRRPARPGGDDYGFALDSDSLDDGGAQSEGPL